MPGLNSTQIKLALWSSPWRVEHTLSFSLPACCPGGLHWALISECLLSVPCPGTVEMPVCRRLGLSTPNWWLSVFTELNGVLNLLPKWGRERGWCYQAAVNSGILLSGRIIWGWQGGWNTWNRQTAPVSSVASSPSPPPQSFWWNNSVLDGKSPGTRLNGLPLHNSMSKSLIPHFAEFCRRKGGTASTHARLGQLPLSAFLSALFSLPLLKSSLAIFIFFLPPTSVWT